MASHFVATTEVHPQPVQGKLPQAITETVNYDPRLISFAIPCRNGAKTVGKLIACLNSLPVPDGWRIEVVVGYQESKDDSLAVLKDCGVKIVHCKGFGPGPARNAAASACRGAYLYFIDADAYPVRNDFVKCFVSAVSALGDFGGIGGPILLEPGQNRNPVAIADHLACWFNWTAVRRSGETRLFQPTANFAVRHSVFDRLGGFDPVFRVLQDFELQERITALGLSGYFLSELAVYHYARGNLAQSLRHSWWWGIPFRTTYLMRKQASTWRFLSQPRWFWLNLPRIYLRRLRIVVANSLWTSGLMFFYAFPFILATLFAWSLGVAVGRGQPPVESESP